MSGGKQSLKIKYLYTALFHKDSKSYTRVKGRLNSSWRKWQPLQFLFENKVGFNRCPQ